LIFGGGVAGLWLLDELHRRSFRAFLIEAEALGAGQTVSSQGILHGGLKYSLAGALTSSAKGVRDMPARWRASLLGESQPDLREVRVLSPCCYMWRTEGLTSRAGLTAARVALRTAVEGVDNRERPEALRSCPGDVFRVEEQVIDIESFLSQMAMRHEPRLLQVGLDAVEFTLRSTGQVATVALRSSGAIEISPRNVVFMAGAGNESLRARIGLASRAMQRRPLHMVMARGKLPAVYGHCVDGMHTRATITTHFDSQGRSVWQIGGEVAERGVKMSRRELIDFARTEIKAVLPRVELREVEWATYAIDRAEGRTTTGQRPEGPVWVRDGNVFTAWPTKLVLAPQLAEAIADELGSPREGTPEDLGALSDWPRPKPALPPWKEAREWRS
jgi:glycine/D-amino acid oxidase-like deaminating enzyme